MTLTGVGVTDVPTAPAGTVNPTCQSLSTPTGTCSGATTTLVPGQSADFTGIYTVTQTDVDNGSIADTATAAGTPPSGGTVTADSNLVTVDVTQSPSLSITKAADPTTVTAAGQTVTYTFTVENTGNSTITGVSVTDLPTPPAGGIVPDCLTRVDPAGTCSGTSTSLVPGETAVFSGTYTVTQADVDNGSIVDTAMTTGTAPSGDTVTANSNQVTVVVTQSPSLSIVKSADPMLVTTVGQIVTYTFTVANTGNVTLTGVGVTDVPTAAGRRRHRRLPEPLEPRGHLLRRDHDARAGPDSATFTGDYTVTQADIDNGSIVDDATTPGHHPLGRNRRDAGSNTVTVDAPNSPSITIAKAASPMTVTSAGEGITYTFTVRNNGNDDLSDVGVTDNPVSPAGGVSPTCQSVSVPPGTCSDPLSLAPGETAIFTATYAVTQADVDHGSIVGHGDGYRHPFSRRARDRRLEPRHGRM